MVCFDDARDDDEIDLSKPPIYPRGTEWTWTLRDVLTMLLVGFLVGLVVGWYLTNYNIIQSV